MGAAGDVEEFDYAEVPADKYDARTEAVYHSDKGGVQCQWTTEGRTLASAVSRQLLLIDSTLDSVFWTLMILCCHCLCCATQCLFLTFVSFSIYVPLACLASLHCALYFCKTNIVVALGLRNWLHYKLRSV